MIISASYRTDIPAFYSQWFLQRLRAGYCKVVNPYSQRVIRVSMSVGDVDGFVFWTKNIGPFLGSLEEVRKLGVPFVVQYAINGHPRELERSVTDAKKAIQHMRLLRYRYGSHVAVWRYDPVIFTSLTSTNFHVANFAELAAGLDGVVNEVVVSFAQIYRKTQRNLNWAAKRFGFSWTDPSDSTKAELAQQFQKIAAGHGIRMTMCSQARFATEGIGEARCISSERLSLVAGRPIGGKRHGNRPECGCDASRDIGDYDTCPNGCVYCYAVTHRQVANERYRKHDPECEFIFKPKRDTVAMDQPNSQLPILLG